MFVHVSEPTSGVSEASKLGQIVGQIWDFLSSVSVHFVSAIQNSLKLIFKSLRFEQKYTLTDL